jgi:MFS family permease
MAITSVANENSDKNFRHNFVVNLLDGSFFWFGYSFISPAVILPLFVSHFTENKIVIGLVAVLSTTGYFFPQLFTANWVEQVAVKKDLPVKLGFFTERMPVLFLPLSTLMAISQPMLTVVLMISLFAWHSFGAGIVAVAWNSMIAKVIPVQRRGFFMGMTTFVGNATGILGATSAAFLLDRYEFPYGFTICFALSAVMIFISWFFLALTRETPDKDLKPRTSQRSYWTRLPEVLKRDANFRWYLLAQLFIGIGGMAWGFMAVYSAEAYSLSDGKVGSFTTAILVGQSIVNLLFGFIADRAGYKIILMISVLLAATGLVLPLFITQPGWMYLVFFLRGASLAGFFLAGLIILEFSTAEVRPTYIGLNSTWMGTINMVSPLIGGLLAQIWGYHFLFTISASLAFFGLIVLLSFVKEPRRLQKENGNFGR